MFNAKCSLRPTRIIKFTTRVINSSNAGRISLPFAERVLVLKSEFNDPHLNLAYENWMYENLNLASHDILFFWQNLPSVVIGRHQNPWLECNLTYLKNQDIKLARRFSGGGTVYHDLGNLNITFLTTRSRYNRKRNLECISSALADNWNLNVDLSSRDDLVIDGSFKISGSAAKLGKYAAYHHCTLLCDANLRRLNDAITSQMVGSSRSTPSITSQVINLRDVDPSLDVNDVVKYVTKAYTHANDVPKVHSMVVLDGYLNAVSRMRDELLTWEWIYAKTSPFTISKTVTLDSGVQVDIKTDIKAGCVHKVELTPDLDIQDQLNTLVTGLRFNDESQAQRICKHPSVQTEFHPQLPVNDFQRILKIIMNVA